MAEAILFSLAKNIITNSQVYKEIGLLCGVKDELKIIGSIVSRIEAVLRDAAKQQNHNEQVKDWLKKLKDAFYDADDLVSEFSTEVSRRRTLRGIDKIIKEVCTFFSSSNQVVFLIVMSCKIKAMRKKLDEIAKENKDFNLEVHPVENYSVSMDREETHSFVLNENVFGREDDKKAIIKLLLDPNVEENVSVVPIVGIGGLGKTTLAQYVYNDDIVKKHFELKMWVCVSDPFEVKVVVEKIIASDTSNKPNDLHMDELQKQLRKKIDGKKYLLVLDDVWNENYNKWDNLKSLLMGGAKGSRIIITTRAKLVAEITSPISIYTLNGLSEDQSWSLFEQIAFRKRQETNHHKLVEIGREILGKCQGVPLAIKSIGGVLCLEKTESKWLDVKDNVLANVLQFGDNIFPILKLSYDHLPSHLKSCFTYCSLFPKDYLMDKKTLIQLWIAQGFIQSSNNKNLEDVADEYLNDLLWRSLFEEVGFRYKMHDLVHDLAQSVAGTECTRVDSYGKNINEKIRHVSCSISIDLSFIKTSNLLVKAEKIRSFLLSEHGCVMNEATLNLLILSFRSLRALGLQGLDIRVLPNSIGELTLLKYLDLSGNMNLITLPDSITGLRNLQTLKLNGCHNLKELPRGITELVNLRHLYNDCYTLSHMPRGLGQLTCLQTLPSFIVSNDPPSISNHVGGLAELNRLNNLRGILEIKHLERLEDGNSESKAANLREKQHLERLILAWDWGRNLNANDNDEMLLEGLQPHQNLKRLYLEYYRGVRFSSWLLFLTNLTYLSLFDCKRCRDLPQLSQLPSLEGLSMSYMDDLEYISEKDISEEVPVSSTPFFPSLNKLEFQNCPNLKGWWRSAPTPHHQQHQSLPSFPRLSSLNILNCPNLNSMPLFPNLQEKLNLNKASVKPLQQTMAMTSSLPSSSSSPSPLSKLKDMTLRDIQNDGGSLPDGWASNLNSLKSLVIRNYPRLTSMSGAMRYLTSLEKLKISRCDEFEPLSDVGAEDDGMEWRHLNCLHTLCFSKLPKLESLPAGLQRVTTLKNLTISDCPNLICLPEWISEFTSLEYLRFTRCAPNLISLPDVISCLKSLKNLRIGGFPNLTTFPEWISNFTSLEKLEIKECPNLTSLPDGIFYLRFLRDLRIQDCLNLTTFPERISELTSLQRLKISKCPNLTSLPDGMHGLSSLQSLEIIRCTNLTSLPDGMHGLSSLQSLEIIRCTNLTSLPDGMHCLGSLQSLEIIRCPNLTSLPDGMHGLSSLQGLRIAGCPHLEKKCEKGIGEDWPKIAHVTHYSNYYSSEEDNYSDDDYSEED